MKKKLSTIIVVTILLLGLVATNSVRVGNTPTLPNIFVDPYVVNDTSIRPDAPSQNVHASTHAFNASVTDPTYAYDGSSVTAASIDIAANPYPGFSFFYVSGFDSASIQSYTAIEIKMNYSVTSSSAQYRILLCVGSAITVLQTWTSQQRTTPYFKVWTGVPEPTDGIWSQTDLSNMRISVETKKTLEAGSGTFKIYETWGAILGDSFLVRINVSSGENIFAWQINMTFNPAYVNTTSASIWEGNFLSQINTTIFLKNTNTVPAGYFGVSCSLSLPYPPQGAYGSGILAFVTFKARASEKATLLGLAEKGTKLNTVISGNNVPLEHTREDGIFDNRVGNAPPVADFNVNASVINVGEIVKFNASASYDPDAWLERYHWDFGDGTTQLFMRERLQDVNLTTTTTHNYTFAGFFTATLAVTDCDGATAAATTDITVQGHNIAVTNVKSSHIAIKKGLPLTVNVTLANKGTFTESFSVTAYYNETTIETKPVTDMPALTKTYLLFFWNTTDVDYGKYILKANATYVPNEYNQSDNEYLDGTVTVSTTSIEDKEVVIGGFTFHVIIETNSVTSNFQFNQAEKKITFNVEGDTGTPGFCNVTIPNDLLGGPYTLLINDTLTTPQETTNGTHTSLYFTYTHSIHTVQISGTTVATPPIAAFTISPTQTIANTLVTFNASSSSDPDGIITSYQWDFGDGNITAITNPAIVHTFANADNYTVTLTVKDNEQLTNSTQANITIIDYPTASFTYTPALPLVNQAITFNASASQPKGGTITEYKWTFGDGNNAQGKTAIHAYADTGDYTVTLNVTDSEGLWNTQSKTVSVSLHDIAVTNLAATPTTAKIGQQITITITVVNKGSFTENATITAYYDDTTISTGSTANLNPEATATVTVLWDTANVAPGTYTLKATATAVNGENLTSDNTFTDGTVTISKQDSQLTLSASPTTITLGETTTISGSLTPALPNKDIAIQYRPTGGTWSTLPNTAATNSQGQYTFLWTPETDGTFEVKASWQGDTTTLQCESNTQQVTVNRQPQLLPMNFLYIIAAAVIIILSLTATYFIKIRKPKST